MRLAEGHSRVNSIWELRFPISDFEMTLECSFISEIPIPKSEIAFTRLRPAANRRRNNWANRVSCRAGFRESQRVRFREACRTAAAVRKPTELPTGAGKHATLPAQA